MTQPGPAQPSAIPPLRPGDAFVTPAAEVTEELRAALVKAGGYTHPLFTRPAEVRLPGGSPLPGQGVLLLMGGLVEQSGRLDDAIALIGLTDVRFRRPAVPGVRINVNVQVISRTPRSPGRAVCEMRWDAVCAADDAILVQATAMMLVSDTEDDASAG